MRWWQNRMAALDRRHRARFGDDADPLPEPPPGEPRPPLMRIKKRSALVIAAFAALLSFLAVWQTLQEIQRVREGETASGIVVKVATVNRRTYAEVEFTTSAGQRVHAKISRGDWRRLPKTGDSVRVRYAISHPGGTAVDARRGAFLRAAFLLLLWIMTLASLGAAYAGWRWSRTPGRPRNIASNLP
ncbi:DUF3592 domain-containing protein [Actinomadura fibrosa]|uniref:DUF3592 domain-containing protein n=1 Tax=Actinomadura fibrosa TaxID=111802 RepID=A0ABW2Y3R8_9ACTN|nr:DUF3592 domain-containing protein [Actinomadura fibrosa]